MEIEAQLESIDSKIEKYNKKTDKLSRLVTSLVKSLEENQQPDLKEDIISTIQEKLGEVNTTSDQTEIKDIFDKIQNNCVENQKGLDEKISELKTAITKANDTLENFSQNANGDIDIDKLFTMFDEFKTNTDLSNRTVSSSMEKIENMFASYNENLAAINTSDSSDAVKDAVKSLNDELYIELLQLFNSLSFEDEAEDLKDFMEDVLSAVTVKTDENSEKLNNIMLQFKNLLNKIENIEKTQNNLSDYLKPEEKEELAYSFDDIQSDLAKMRLILNDLTGSVSTQDGIEEISEKLKYTSEQIESISVALGTNSQSTENDNKDIKQKIEDLNEQIYDISMRTNKLILTNEDSTIELKNNLEVFKEVFDKANPEKLYELFYELTHYFNDVNERINEVTLTSKASHAEAVTIKNALVYVGEWLDNATNVLEELRMNSTEILNKEPEVQDNQDLLNGLAELKRAIDDSVATVFTRLKISEENNIIINQEIKNLHGVIDENSTTILARLKANEENTAVLLKGMNDFCGAIGNSVAGIATKLKANEENTQKRLDSIEKKLDAIIKTSKAPAKETTSRTLTTKLTSIDKKFGQIEKALAKLSPKRTKV